MKRSTQIQLFILIPLFKLMAQATPATTPLALYWGSERGDNFTTGTYDGEKDAQNAGYSYVRNEGFLYLNQIEGTVPLILYWASGRGDNFTTATEQGKKDALAAGYAYRRIEGYLYPDMRDGTVALKLFWSSEREDNFITSTEQGEKDALAAGYKFIRVEGYVLPARNNYPKRTITATPTEVTQPNGIITISSNGDKCGCSPTTPTGNKMYLYNGTNSIYRVIIENTVYAVPAYSINSTYVIRPGESQYVGCSQNGGRECFSESFTIKSQIKI